MTVSEDERDTRRRCRTQLFLAGNEDNVGSDVVDDGQKQNKRRAEACSRLSGGTAFQISATTAGSMHKSTKTGIIGIVALVILIGIILLINWKTTSSNPGDSCVNLNADETCYSRGGKNFYRNYGTKTSYHIASNETAEEFQMQGCKPHIFYLLSRHATRYPDKDDINEMLLRLPVLRERIINASLLNISSMCQGDVNRITTWGMTLRPDDDNKLSNSGKMEAEELAQRYKQRFPAILGRSYNEKDFVFEYTSRERTRSTAEAFAEGLFGKERAESINFDGKTNDDVLQFHKECKSLMKNCKDSKIDLKELEKFQDGPLMKSVASSMSRRLGFNVTKDDVEVMYRACSFAYALQNDDAWCTVFTADELKVIEYEGDLDDYYKDGYGNNINYEQACPVVNYVVNLFNSSTYNTEDRAILHFSHAGAVKKVYPRFGLFQDKQKLTADGFCSHQDRKWKSSLISPFNSNLVIVLLKCGTEYKVTAFHNEHEVTLGGCSNEVCPLKEFFKQYTPVAENCHIKNMCCTCCKT